MSATVLGRFSITVYGDALEMTDWGHRSAERLLKLLLVAPGHALRREAAAEQLWPDAAHGRAAGNLRRAWHFLRRAVERDGSRPLLASSRWEIGFAPAAQVVVDLDQLRAAGRHLSLALANQSATSGDDLDEALAVVVRLGSKELLPDDQAEEWTTRLRDELLVTWERACILAGERAVRDGRPARAHQLAEQVLERDPASEDAHRLLIRALVDQGLPHVARRQLVICRRALLEAFDVEPAPETIAASLAASPAF